MKKVLVAFLGFFLLFFGCVSTGFKVQSARKWHSFNTDAEVSRHPGGKSHRFELRHGDFWQNRYGHFRSNRVEVRKFFEANSGQTWWYGFAMMVSKESDNPKPWGDVKLGQWHTPDNGRKGWGPEIQNLWSADGFRIHVWSETVKIDFKKGEWTDFIYQFKFGRKGFANVWVNGKQVLEYEGVVTTVGDVYFKYGIYIPGGILPGEVYLVHYDEYRRGKSYEDVDPSILK